MGPTPSVGAFEVMDQIAEGGMGTIWRGRHPDGDVVAIKFVTARYAEQEAYRAGFRREVEAVAGLSHVGIVAVYDYGEVGELAATESEALTAGMPWLAMEFADLGSVEQVVIESWEELRVVLYDVLDALAHAHARGVIHRDLKPANVLVTQTADGELLLKLSDFGIAQRGRDAQESNDVFGTPIYMAPEQFAARIGAHGPWTDLYALGVMAFELACGRPPFEHSGIYRLGQAHMKDPVPPLDPQFELPGRFDEWLSRLLEKEPRARFCHAADARWALEQLDPHTDRSPIPMRLTDASDSSFGMRSDWASARTLPLLLQDDGYEAEPTAGFSRNTPSSRAPIPATWHVPDAAARTRALLSGVGLGLFGLRPVPFVGRVHERDVIWQTLRAVARESKPRAVVVRGEAGCGKSRLAEWIAQRAVELGAAEVVVARHDSMETGTRQLATSLARAFRLPDTDRRAAFAHLRDDLGVDSASAVSALLTGDGAAVGDAEVVDFASDNERYAAALTLVEQMSAERPTIVWVDDAQWGADMAAFANYVLDSDTSAAVLFLCTVRTGVDAAEQPLLNALSAHLRSIEMELAALNAEERRQQIERILRLPTDVVQSVADRSEGNPLFAVQLVGDWVERGVLVRGDAGFELRDRVAAIPDDIHALWLQRVADLERRFGVAASTCLRIAAAVGDEVGRQMWRLCCEVIGVEIPSGLVQSMVTRRLAHRTDDGFRFAHRMFRESLEREAREGGVWTRHNGACAAILELLHPEPGPSVATRTARHLIEANEADDALDLLLRAGTTVLAREELTDLEAILRVAREARDAARVPPEDERSGLIRMLEMKLHRHRGEFRLSDPKTASLLHDARKHGWSEVEAIALFDAGASLALTDAPNGRAQLFEAVELFDGDEQVRRRALAFKHLSHVYALRGNSALAAQCATDAFQLFTTLRDTGQKAWCMYYLGLGRRVASDTADAERRLLDALSLAAEAGLRDLQANCHNVLADLWRMDGDLDRACEGYERAEQLWRAMGSAHVAAAQFNLGMSELERGQFAAARQRLSALQPKFERHEQNIPLAATHVVLLACAAEADDETAARGHLERGRDLLEQTGLVDPDVLVALETAAKWFARHDREELRLATAELARDQRAAMT